MNSVAQNKKKNKRYLPHEWTTRIYAVQLYRQTKDIGFVCRRYHISKASLMRWNKQYDGTKESLRDKSHRPHSVHPNAHTEEELTGIELEVIQPDHNAYYDVLGFFFSSELFQASVISQRAPSPAYPE